MRELRFTLPFQQQATPLIGVCVLLLIAGVAAALGGIGFAIPLGSIALFVLVLYGLVMYGSYGILDETGIRSRRGVFRNRVMWANVRAVAPDPKSGECLIVYRHHGRPFKLGAPISGGLSTNPNFRQETAQTLAYVSAHVTTTGAPPAP
ncbi:hypothetical protein ABZ901_10805 [Actinacidiphila alni]|uniref:hypothetical protein n=1 Tax=Actinacidiphila alni TaxID=380248 RepID=UPI0033F7B119